MFYITSVKPSLGTEGANVSNMDRTSLDMQESEKDRVSHDEQIHGAGSTESVEFHTYYMRALKGEATKSWTSVDWAKFIFLKGFLVFLVAAVMASMWLFLPVNGEKHLFLWVKLSFIGFVYGLVFAFFLTDIFCDANGNDIDPPVVISLISLVMFPLGAWCAVKLNGDVFSPYFFLVGCTFAHLAITLVYAAVLTRKLDTVRLQYPHHPIDMQSELERAGNTANRLPRRRASFHRNITYLRTFGIDEEEKSTFGLIPHFDIGLSSGRFRWSAFFGTSVGLYFIALQITFSMMFGYQFSSWNDSQKVIACALYPFLIQVFKGAALFLSHQHARLLYGVEFFSLMMAAVPFRLIFMDLLEWHLFLAIMGIVLVYKSIIYHIRLSRTVDIQVRRLTAYLEDKIFQTERSHAYIDSSRVAAISEELKEDMRFANHSRKYFLHTMSDLNAVCIFFPCCLLSVFYICFVLLFFFNSFLRCRSLFLSLHCSCISCTHPSLPNHTHTPVQLFGAVVIMQIQRWGDPSSFPNNFPNSQWNRLLLFFFLALCVEIVVIVTVGLLLRYGHERGFRPLTNSKALVDDNLVHFFLMSLLTFCLSFLILEPNQFPHSW